jgi:hypothetical protein
MSPRECAELSEAQSGPEGHIEQVDIDQVGFSWSVRVIGRQFEQSRPDSGRVL